MYIGIIPVLNSDGGGIYQYSLNMLHVLREWKDKKCEDEFVVFAHDIHHPNIASLNMAGWVTRPVTPFSLKKLGANLLRPVLGEKRLLKLWGWLGHSLHTRSNPPDPNAVRYRPDIRRRFHHFGVELMLYPAPNTLSFETGIPYVMAIHDLQHRLQPEFPEVSANGEWEVREYLFRNGARYATLLLVDSEVGKEDVLNFYGPYGVTPDRVKVLPFLPACYLPVDVSENERQRVRMTYHLPQRYLFYPAQFWPHKNHARIIQALGLIAHERHLKIPIVFCGSYNGEIREHTFHEAMSLGHQLGIDKEIHFIGYVPDEDMAALYAGAAALVMPTFFGPTNIPVLEAWALGCPVITSDIRGIREQVDHAAILVDPKSAEAIADGIYRLWTEDHLRRTLADQGRQRLSSYTHDDYRQRLIEVLEEAKARVRSETTNYAR